MNVIKRKFSFQSKYDDVPIHGVCFIPEQPVGILQMVHGMNEHKGRYISFMQYMAEKGFVTLMHDNRGHGESVRNVWDIGYCYASKDKGYVEDIYAVTRYIKRAFPGLPVVLYGHSMGSLGVRTYLKKHDIAIDGLIVAGNPSYKEILPPVKLFVTLLERIYGDRMRSPLLQNLVSSDFEKPFAKENRTYAWIAAKESVAVEFVKDPLNCFTYTLNGFQTLLNLEWSTFKASGYLVRNPKLPILFVSGMDDPCYISEDKWYASIDRMKKLGYSDISEKRYPDMRHEIHNEENCEAVYEDLCEFCRECFNTKG